MAREGIPAVLAPSCSFSSTPLVSVLLLTLPFWVSVLWHPRAVLLLFCTSILLSTGLARVSCEPLAARPVACRRHHVKPESSYQVGEGRGDHRIEKYWVYSEAQEVKGNRLVPSHESPSAAS